MATQYRVKEGLRELVRAHPAERVPVGALAAPGAVSVLADDLVAIKRVDIQGRRLWNVPWCMCILVEGLHTFFDKRDTRGIKPFASKNHSSIVND
jgi:hypothetical protein